jgi:hypothetical protein
MATTSTSAVLARVKSIDVGPPLLTPGEPDVEAIPTQRVTFEV